MFTRRMSVLAPRIARWYNETKSTEPGGNWPVGVSQHFTLPCSALENGDTGFAHVVKGKYSLKNIGGRCT